jgi:hypothetical protein
MITQIERLTAAEVEAAVDRVRAHLNDLYADAVESGAGALEVHLREVELQGWMHRLELAPERAAEVLAAVAGTSEERIVTAFLASLAEREAA